MHIALVIPDLKGGGAQKMMINLANELAGGAHHVDLIVLNEGGPYLNQIDAKVTIYNFEKGRTLKAVPSLAAYLRQKQPDIMMSALFHVNLAAVIARQMSGIQKTKLVISERNQLSLRLGDMGVLKSAVIKLLVRKLYPRADAIIGISNGVCEDLKNYIKTDKKDFIRTIYNPVVTDDFEKKLTENVAPVFPDNCGVKIVASGRLVAQKDYPTMLNAFARYRKQYGPAHLVILGDGPLKDSLQAQAKNLEINAHVDFAGFHANPLAVMKQADIFLVTSAWEGFCNVIVEALYCGLGIVATDCPSGPSEILDKGIYGTLCSIGDVKALSKAISTVANQSVDQVAQKSRAMEFSADKKAKEFENLFMELLSA